MLDQEKGARVVGIIRITCVVTSADTTVTFTEIAWKLLLVEAIEERPRRSTHGGHGERDERDRDREREYGIRTFYRSSSKRYDERNRDRERDSRRRKSSRSFLERYRDDYK